MESLAEPVQCHSYVCTYRIDDRYTNTEVIHCKYGNIEKIKRTLSIPYMDKNRHCHRLSQAT
jgi:hypothetical protein